MNYKTREFYQRKWVTTYFQKMSDAKKLCRKILKAGGIAICLRA